MARQMIPARRYPWPSPQALAVTTAYHNLGPEGAPGRTPACRFVLIKRLMYLDHIGPSEEYPQSNQLASLFLQVLFPRKTQYLQDTPRLSLVTRFVLHVKSFGRRIAATS
jgi:hypothetical protein